jgi:hypothetical protein
MIFDAQGNKALRLPVNGQGYRESSGVVDTWTTERRSCGVQGWHQPCADRPAVRLIPIGRADSVEV